MLRRLRSKKGIGLIDVMVTLFLLSVAGIIFSATFPAAFSCSRKSQEYKLGTAIAQRKMEQLRAMNYESLTEPLLHQAGVIDSDSMSSPYTFTAKDSLALQLTTGKGTIAITDISSHIKKVQVTITWQSRTESSPRSITLTTYFADKRTRSLSS
jgi:hypothetical protein